MQLPRNPPAWTVPNVANPIAKPPATHEEPLQIRRREQCFDTLYRLRAITYEWAGRSMPRLQISFALVYCQGQTRSVLKAGHVAGDGQRTGSRRRAGIVRHASATPSAAGHERQGEPEQSQAKNAFVSARPERYSAVSAQFKELLLEEEGQFGPHVVELFEERPAVKFPHFGRRGQGSLGEARYWDGRGQTSARGYSRFPGASFQFQRVRRPTPQIFSWRV